MPAPDDQLADADLPEREVAELMGVSVGTVETSVSRGLDRMKTALTQEVA